jgi:two-component system, NtrC family, sensor kinase
MAQAQLPTLKTICRWLDSACAKQLKPPGYLAYFQVKRLSPKWHYIYYLLAAFDLLTVSASLYLNHRITNIYAQSVRVNQTWATRLHHYYALDQLAAAVNAPGNNVFDSHDPQAEAQRLEIALHNFQKQMFAVRQELQTYANPPQSTQLLRDLDALDVAMDSMVSEADQIFSDFRQNQPELAGRRMATMDRKYHQVNQALNQVNLSVGAIQQQVFAQQKQETDALKRYEYAIALLIVVMIVSVTLYGHKLAQQVQTSVQERERSFQHLQQAETFLREQSAQLERSFNDLQAMQARLIESEKMSALGTMVAGVAHEINNPINFIHGNLKHAGDYSQDLLALLHLYRQQYPSPTPQIQQIMQAIDVDFIEQDLPNLLSSMQVGTERIREIVKSLRNFSCLDEAEFKSVNLHEGLDSTLMVLHSRLTEKPNFPDIEVIKNYGTLPFVACYPRQLHQVFMHILSNAIDAIEGVPAWGYRPHSIATDTQATDSPSTSPSSLKSAVPTIHIRTEVLPDNFVAIHITDNGSGIPEPIRPKIFDPFFTTKAVGKGSGLGLSSSYKIVVEKHGGRLQCYSKPGQGTEFVIEIPIQPRETSRFEVSSLNPEPFSKMASWEETG